MRCILQLLGDFLSYLKKIFTKSPFILRLDHSLKRGEEEETISRRIIRVQTEYHSSDHLKAV